MQKTLQDAARGIFGETIRFHASGRTDAGVHALGQVAHADIPSRCLLNTNAHKILRSLNSKLPSTLRVLKVANVPEAFHAMKSAISKQYRYRILTGPADIPIASRFAWHLPYTLNIEQMKETLAALVGTFDFKSFQSAGTPLKSTTRTILSTDLGINADPFLNPFLSSDYMALDIRFRGTGFLKQMVRNLVGTLVKVGRGHMSPDEFSSLLEARDRTKAGVAAPSQGLTLEKVYYSDPLF